MEILEQTQQWLTAFPGWDTAQLHTDTLGASPGEGALQPLGLETLHRREDVLGRKTRRFRCRFRLQWVYPQPDADRAQWLLTFQQWVAQQSEQGLAPVFGHDTRWYAAGGKCSGSKGPGTGLYTLELTAEFTKIYEEE